MSEEWKSERAEVEMRQGTDAIMKAAQEKAKQEEDQKWEAVKAYLAIGHEDKKDSIDFVIELLKNKYDLPELRE
jgi:hypothetical protein